MKIAEMENYKKTVTATRNNDGTVTLVQRITFDLIAPPANENKKGVLRFKKDKSKS